jgi:hypothetical protein
LMPACRRIELNGAGLTRCIRGGLLRHAITCRGPGGTSG